jgi:hypothetical protein
MTTLGDNAAAGPSAPDYKELRNYLVGTVMQDLAGTDLTSEKLQQVVQKRLSEALSHMKLSLSEANRK